MKTAQKVFAHDRHWREAKPDERRLILEEYVTGLRKREEVNRLLETSLMPDLRARVTSPKYPGIGRITPSTRYINLHSLAGCTRNDLILTSVASG